MTTIRITYLATTVRVTDDRESVRGIMYEAKAFDGRAWRGTAIPAEGDGLECWLLVGEKTNAAGDMPKNLVSALATFASEGAKGRSNTVEIEG